MHTGWRQGRHPGQVTLSLSNLGSLIKSVKLGCTCLERGITLKSPEGSYLVLCSRPCHRCCFWGFGRLVYPEFSSHTGPALTSFGLLISQCFPWPIDSCYSSIPRHSPPLPLLSTLDLHLVCLVCILGRALFEVSALFVCPYVSAFLFSVEVSEFGPIWPPSPKSGSSVSSQWDTSLQKSW